MLKRVVAFNSSFDRWTRDHQLAAVVVLLPFVLLLFMVIEKFRIALQLTLAMYVFVFGTIALIEIAAVLLEKSGASRLKAIGLPPLSVGLAIALYALGATKALIYPAAGIVAMGLLVVLPAVYRHFKDAQDT